MVVIGIDTGIKTGVAIWCQDKRKITFFEAMPIHRALAIVQLRSEEIALVRVEDARKRRWVGVKGNAKAQGAGSVKRDAKIWEDMLSDLKIPFELVAPVKGSTYKATKSNPKRMHDFHRIFPNIPRLTTFTEDHIRDAVHLCYGINKNYTKSFKH